VARVRDRDRFVRLEHELQSLVSSQARLKDSVAELKATEKALVESALPETRWESA